MSDWPFGDLTPLKYRVILADPPWYFKNWSAKGEVKNPVSHYSCMTLAEIQELPVGQLAAPDCLLVLWATAPMLPQAIATVKAWDFTYKTAGAWAKRSKTGGAWAFGTGYILRSAAEFWLVGTLGHPKPGSRSVRNLIEAPIGDHSQKPYQMHDMIEQLVPHGPYCELFARERRRDWDSWGLEVDKV